jgi:hypothetical protein
MKFRLLALWPSKDILPAPITCDTACEAMRHHRLLRRNKVGTADALGNSPARADWLSDDGDGLRGKASADGNRRLAAQCGAKPA